MNPMNSLNAFTNGIPMLIKPNLSLTESIINQPIPPTGFNTISVNHGLPNGTLVQYPYNPFNQIIGNSNMIQNASFANQNTPINPYQSMINQQNLIMSVDPTSLNQINGTNNFMAMDNTMMQNYKM